MRLAISRDLSVVAFPVFYTDVVMLVPSVQAVGMTRGQAQPAFASLQRVLSIDVATETRVQRGLARLLAGRTSLVIAHRLSTIRGADPVVVLEAGRVVEQGSPEAESSACLTSTFRSGSARLGQLADLG